MTQSKIKRINNVRDWTGDKGTVFYFDLEMENGDSGSIGKKSREALKVGDTLNYTLETGERGNKIKEIKDNNFGGGSFGKGSARAGNESFALSYAKDIIVAQIAAGKTGDLKTREIGEATQRLAEEFYIWLEGKK